MATERHIYHCITCQEHYSLNILGQYRGKLEKKELIELHSIGYKGTSGYCSIDCFEIALIDAGCISGEEISDLVQETIKKRKEGIQMLQQRAEDEHKD